MDNKKAYYSFFVSMKQMQTEDDQTWLVAVRDVRTGRQQIFSSLKGLIQFLQTEFGEPVESAPQDVQVWSEQVKVTCEQVR